MFALLSVGRNIVSTGSEDALDMYMYGFGLQFVLGALLNECTVFAGTTCTTIDSNTHQSTKTMLMESLGNRQQMCFK